MSAARMRTLDAAIAQLHADDPECCLTRHALRKMVLEGKVPHVRAGSKRLLNYDSLLAVLAGEVVHDVEVEQRGVIRRIV